MSFIKLIKNKVIERKKNALFQQKWRETNKHNYTYLANSFPDTINANDIVEIGYNADDIRAFIPPHMRTFNDMISCGDCDENKCAYHNDSAVLAKEIKEAFEAEER